MVNVKKIVTMLLWLPILSVILSGALAISILTVRTALNSPIPDLTQISIGVDPGLILLAIGAGFAALYWFVINATFSDETIDDAIQNAEEVRDTVDESTSGFYNQD